MLLPGGEGQPAFGEWAPGRGGAKRGVAPVVYDKHRGRAETDRNLQGNGSEGPADGHGGRRWERRRGWRRDRPPRCTDWNWRRSIRASLGHDGVKNKNQSKTERASIAAELLAEASGDPNLAKVLEVDLSVIMAARENKDRLGHKRRWLRNQESSLKGGTAEQKQIAKMFDLRCEEADDAGSFSKAEVVLGMEDSEYVRGATRRKDAKPPITWAPLTQAACVERTVISITNKYFCGEGDADPEVVMTEEEALAPCIPWLDMANDVDEENILDDEFDPMQPKLAHVDVCEDRRAEIFADTLLLWSSHWAEISHNISKLKTKSHP